jgi:DNA polymerase-3 subunit gamma/tau
LDAASNNSVDDIRSLVEQVRYPPQGSAFKVYIVDEVHMLSTSAFNALLKTLEEPPSYAKFILATTEKHKILPTILSRCQIFDFKRIRPQDIADRLALVCKAEQITYDAEALLTIAGRSDGALRDALTMLDQLAGYGGGHLGQTLVAEQLGVLNQQGFLDATETLQKGDPGPTLQILGTLIARGYDPIQWVLGMAVHLRNLLMAKAPGTLERKTSSASVAKRYRIPFGSPSFAQPGGIAIPPGPSAATFGGNRPLQDWLPSQQAAADHRFIPGYLYRTPGQRTPPGRH